MKFRKLQWFSKKEIYREEDEPRTYFTDNVKHFKVEIRWGSGNKAWNVEGACGWMHPFEDYREAIAAVEKIYPEKMIEILEDIIEVEKA